MCVCARVCICGVSILLTPVGLETVLDVCFLKPFRKKVVNMLFFPEQNGDT